MNAAPRITILLAAYNGLAHIDAQLDSLAAQTVGPLRVMIQDDGSTDGTAEHVDRNRSHWPGLEIELCSGPRLGAVENFRSLVLRADPECAFYAFCDQDDIWHPDKLARALAWLDNHPDGPALFCGRTRTITDTGQVIGLSPLFARPPSIRNALVQSLAGGNTMVMNRPAFQLLRASLQQGTPVLHDWWTYIIVAAAGGDVHYDPRPLVDYRQHAGNLIGANDRLSDRLHRLRQALRGRFSEWTRQHLDLLQACAPMLTPEALRLCSQLQAIRAARFPRRLRMLAESGLYRQTRAGQASLVLACALGKL